MKPSTKGPIMNDKIAAVKNHVKKHRAKYAVAGTLVVCTVIHIRIVSNLNRFLDDHDLMDMYYTNGE
ncbi:gp044 [Rhodococcus phage ReqiPoco6]|uniref:Gp044 n=1 Tax=Rhodococcus phage ReqiPoco6 TaxID=691964 RepID=D4P7R2_9CAUD|nr:gp044 [Rhodococcus phage ReqiPoco6]ADD81042.1 gp044 [Rhodococcus phage ReqiPoco6]